jgi:FdhD protein
MIKSCKKVSIEKVRSKSKEALKDKIPVELILTIFLNDTPIAAISCFPDDLTELVIGYLINNGYIEKYSDITLIRLCDKEIIKNDIPAMSVRVEASCIQESNKAIDIKPKYISSGCGSFDDLILKKQKEMVKIKNKIKINPEIILKLNSETIKNQRFKKEFGGLHCASLFDCQCNFLYLMEDIGRHNCIDKLAGYIQTRKINASDKIIFTTGRISIDLVYKIHRMSIPFIVSNSSITHGAVLLAKRAGITAIGYARGGRFNIYSCPSRIISKKPGF